MINPELLNYFVNFFKYISHWPFYFLLVFLSLLIKSYRKPIYWCLLGAIINCLVNIDLKGFFKVPLPAFLHPGYAYPSGHMQTAIFVYTWLALNRMFGIHYVIALIIPGIAYTLHFFHFHTYWEIFAGMGCGLIYTIFFVYFYQYPQSLLKNLSMMFSIALMIAFYQNYKMHFVYIIAPLFILLTFVPLNKLEIKRYSS